MYAFICAPDAFTFAKPCHQASGGLCSYDAISQILIRTSSPAQAFIYAHKYNYDVNILELIGWLFISIIKNVLPFGCGCFFFKSIFNMENNLMFYGAYSTCFL